VDELITLSIQISCLLPIIAFAIFKKIEINSTYILLSIAYIFTNFALLNYASYKPLSDLVSWNWVGKASALAFSLIIILVLPKLRIDAGFTLRQKSNSIAKSLTAVTMLFFAGAGLSLLKESTPFSIETILFQLTMPSLDEEIAYRGIFLYLLCKGISPNNKSNFNIAVIFIIFFFGAAHGVRYDNGDLNINLWSFLITASVGAVLMYIRLLSGSIVLPILGHSVFNVTLLSGAMIQYHG
jgi:membrane protease YdiL (CAAX protease family)